jgi:hypothetical protein
MIWCRLSGATSLGFFRIREHYQKRIEGSRISNPPSSPFVKRGKHFSSLWQREAGRDFKRFISNRSIESIFS